MMTKDLTSIVMTCYDQTQNMRHITMAAIANITKFTNPQDYELIIVDCCPQERLPIKDGQGVLKIDKHIVVPPPDIGYYAAMNLGAKEAQGEFLCFIENDIFVNEGWLDGLKKHVMNGQVDVIMPSQIPASRDWVLQSYLDDDVSALKNGMSEQGMMLLKTDDFRKMSGWRGTFGFGWKKLYEQLVDSRLNYGCTSKVIITHITGVTYYHQLENNYEKFTFNNMSESVL